MHSGSCRCSSPPSWRGEQPARSKRARCFNPPMVMMSTRYRLPRPAQSRVDALAPSARPGVGKAGRGLDRGAVRRREDNLLTGYADLVTDWLPAMLAERARSVPSLEAFSFEPKWDGVRALVLVRDGAVHVRSRHGTDLTSRFPELAGLADVVDGASCSTASSSSSTTTARPASTASATASSDRARRRVDAAAVDAGDARRLRRPRADGRSLVTSPYAERRAALEALHLRGPAWRTTPIALGAARGRRPLPRRPRLAHRRTRRQATCRPPTSPGRRSASWLKMKWPWARDVVAFKAHLAAKYA